MKMSVSEKFLRINRNFASALLVQVNWERQFGLWEVP
jgi:hypothetical protein